MQRTARDVAPTASLFSRNKALEEGTGMGMGANTAPVQGGYAAAACSEINVEGGWLGNLDSNQD